MTTFRALACVVCVAALAIPACGGDNNNNNGGSGGNPPGADGGVDSSIPGNDGGPIATDDGGTQPTGPRTEAVCTVSKTGTAGLLLQGTVLAPEDTIHNGQVLINTAGVITCVAQDCSTAAGAADATVVACPDGVISPGLINTHDHITYANNAPIGHGTERFNHRQDWRAGLNGHTKIDYKSQAPVAVVQFAELRFVMSGATSTAGAGGAPGLLRNVDTTAAQLQGLNMKIADSQTFPLGDSSRTAPKQLSSGCDYGSSRDTEATVEPLAGYLPHIAEGIDANARNEITCQNIAPYNLLQKQTAIVHSIATTPVEAAIYRTQQTSVIWSPRTNVDLYGNTAPVTMLDNQGVQIALGTDWMPSGSMNMARELRCVDELNTNYYGKHFSDQDIWRMATTNAAFAVGGQRVIGMLKPGYVADISIYYGKYNKDHRAVIAAGVEDVVLVLRGGKPLYGDAAIVSDKSVGGDTCEDFDVCGVAKRACVAKDIGGTTTLASIRAAGEAVYPLFYCGHEVPKNEPSCVPYREEYKAGITAGDKDGDGIPDATDNCPDVFNPIRPVDGTTQPNADGDAKGDACDRCPNDANDACPQLSGNDVDGDGIPNGVDNCPELANADQADADKDGYGDACPNVVAPPPPPPATSTIPDLRDTTRTARPAVGTRVHIEGAVVTAIKSAGTTHGFSVQDPTATKWAGIYIYANSATVSVSVGDVVSVTGTLSPFRGWDEIVVNGTTNTYAKTGTAALPAPIVLSPTDFNTGSLPTYQYQSMLVRVNNVVAITPWSTTGFSVGPVATTPAAEQLLVTSFLAMDVTPPTAPSKYLAVAGTTYSSITGIVDAYAPSATAAVVSRLAPRNEADIVTP